MNFDNAFAEYQVDCGTSTAVVNVPAIGEWSAMTLLAFLSLIGLVAIRRRTRGGNFSA